MKYILALALSMTTTAYAAVLRCQPESISLNSKAEFTVEVRMSDVANLYGGNFDLVFEPELLQAVKVEEGDFLKQGGMPTSFLKQIQSGRVVIGISRLGETGGITGSGVLAVITLRPRASGTATMRFTNVSFLNPSLGSIPADLQPGVINLQLTPLRLEISPSQSTVLTNQLTTVSIRAIEAYDLYGASLDLVFDPAQIKIVSATEGNLLNQGGTATSFLKAIDNDRGRVTLGVTRLGQASGVNGTGTLCSFTLKGSVGGTASLRLANVSLQDSFLDTIATDLIPAVINVLPVDLRITPGILSVLSNQDFNLQVVINNAVDLYGASFDLSFDPELMRVSRVIEGDFLKQAVPAPEFLYTIDNERGRVIIGASRLEGISGITGSGSLCSLVLHSKNWGKAKVVLENVSLTDSSRDNFTPTTKGSTIDILPARLEFALPKTDYIYNGNKFDAVITVTSIASLYGAAFDVIFDADVLEVATVTDGGFLSKDGGSTQLLSKADGGTLTVGISRMGEATMVSGYYGELCRITFSATTTGSSQLKLTNVSLTDIGLNQIGCSGGTASVTVITPPPPDQAAGINPGNIAVYPNPVMVCQGQDQVCFDLPAQATVRIYNLAGELVASPSGNVWKLTDKIASGIYIYLVTGDGWKRTGRIGVVR